MRRGILAVGVTLAVVFAASQGGAETFRSDGWEIGEGRVASYVESDGDGRPVAIGIALSERALAGLPKSPNRSSRCFDLDGNGRINASGECEGDYEYPLVLPRGLPPGLDLPFKWIGVNWNPAGHEPAFWSVPHFDIHFYIASRNEIALIGVGACKFFIDCGDREVALRPVPEKYVADGHINVDAAVSLMGNHLIDSRTPELGNPPGPFTHTWIYGAFDGRITFYEPMITLAFLESRENVCVPIRQPQAWQQAGYYPTEYCIRYLPERKEHTVSLEKFVRREAG